MRSFAIQNTEKEKANMTEELKNAGYTIIESFTVGEQGFALGHSDTAPAPYVTWQYRAAAPDHFFWGHYMNSKEAAYADYRNRINSEIEHVSKRIQPQRTKKRDEPGR